MRFLQNFFSGYSFYSFINKFNLILVLFFARLDMLSFFLQMEVLVN